MSISLDTLKFRLTNHLFILDTDASNASIGAVYIDGAERDVALQVGT